MRFVVQKEEEEPLRCLQGNHRRATVQFRVLADRGAPIPRPQRGGIPRQLLVVPLICQEPWLRAKEQEGATPEVRNRHRTAAAVRLEGGHNHMILVRNETSGVI